MQSATHELIPCSASLSAPSTENLATLKDAERFILTLPQVEIPTEHVFHAGMYARTIRIPAGTVLTGALMKIPTILIVQGEAKIFVDGDWYAVNGYTVLTGAAGRKQMFAAATDVEMTMIFTTPATTVDEAEREFTDEFESLMSRRSE